MAQEALRARARAVGARLEHDDQVADFGDGEVHAVGEQIERRAQRADDRRRLARGRRRSGCRSPPDSSCASPGRNCPSRQVMVQAAVGDQEHLAARDLAVDDAADVDAGFADQVAAELDDERAPAAARVRARSTSAAQVGADRRQIERAARPGKYGMPKPPPRFSTRTGAGACCGQPQRELDRTFAAPRRSTRRCRFCEPANRWKPSNARPARRSRASSAGTCFGVDAELLRPAAHLHARALELEIGVDAHRDARRQCRARCDVARAARLRASIRR